MNHNEPNRSIPPFFIWSPRGSGITNPFVASLNINFVFPCIVYLSLWKLYIYFLTELSLSLFVKLLLKYTHI